MLKEIKKTLGQTFAIVEKELVLRTRFPLSFISSIFVSSIISLIPLIFIFSGLLKFGFSDYYSIYYFLNAKNDPFYYYLLFTHLEDSFFSTFNQTNYLSWLLIGNVLFTFCNKGFIVFQNSFQQEKYWQTLEGLFLAPINKYQVLFGSVIVNLIESSLYFIVFIIFCYIIYPVPIYQIFLLFLILCIMLIASTGFGLIVGAILISTESFNVFFQLIQFVILFFSCYSIPLILFPESFQFIAELNPFYHGVFLARNVYYGRFTLAELISLIYILVFSILISIISVFLFNKIWKNYGIQGY